MQLRKHQQRFKKIINDIVSGSSLKNIYCHCAPGSGKSLLPVIAGKLIAAGMADKLVWVAPRLSLIDQGEREFISPAWNDVLGYRIKVRSSTNEINPSRGLQGFCTTYQAVGLDEGILRHEFSRYRYILILDEWHHIAVGSTWEKKIMELWGLAAYRILMSGTLERGDGEQIAFLPYKADGPCFVPDLRETPDTATVHYKRSDALNERAIIPLSFHLSDGRAEWQEKTGRKRKIASINKVTETEATKALYTSLKTEFADELLLSGLSHFKKHIREVNAFSKCLVVTSNISEAKRHLETIEKSSFGLRIAIATSEDSQEALQYINKMKRGLIDVLVTVAMAYEGLSIPAVSHIICLTRIRSTPWIDQMTARANRIDPDAGPYESQFGYIFAPADPLFKMIVEKIEAEQLPYVETKSDQGGKGKQRGKVITNNDGLPPQQASPGGITALSSEMTGKHEIVLTNKLVLESESINVAPQPLNHVANAGKTIIREERTQREIEANLLKQIESHIRTFAFQNRYNPKKINAEIYGYYGKKRRDMTVPELESCLSYIKWKYPLLNIRGTGRPRVPAKAVPINIEWRLAQ